MKRLLPRGVSAMLLTTIALAMPGDDSLGAPTPPAPVPDSTSATEDGGIRLVLPAPTGRIDKRLFGIIPNHRADQETGDYKPLKTWEKFKIAERDTFDWPNYFLTAGFAMQTLIAERGWHGTAMGRNFAEYYGRSFSDAFIGNYITEALMPSLLHEDPRFFRSGVGSIRQRTFKAVRQVFVTRTENGNQRFNFSEILGNTAVTAVTSIYYPDNRRLGYAAERIGMQIGNDMISNLLTEFWPDIRRHMQPLLHHHARSPEFPK